MRVCVQARLHRRRSHTPRIVSVVVATRNGRPVYLYGGSVPSEVRTTFVLDVAVVCALCRVATCTSAARDVVFALQEHAAKAAGRELLGNDRYWGTFQVCG
jgi:hypothetical protein